ncbi:MAG: hypothetical protein JXR41_02920 [Bacteroidales bacterium]|nr:hypothetical protein [Bacteroidales bacterium]MBN2762018.1 hypothetical protein [Bacteroidales bacterium]
MKKAYILCLLLSIPLARIFCQLENVSFSTEALAGYISPDKMPFWLRSNRFGSIPLDNASLSLLGAVRKDYDPVNKGIFDWGTSIEGRLNMGNQLNFILVEGYGKLRVSIFELKAGRSKDITGLCDTSLSSGSWTISGNALGIPKVQISIPEFYTIPWLGKLFAFKSQIMHGWFGETIMYRYEGFDFYDEDTIYLNAFLHQFSFYGRFGKPGWKLKLYGGFNHQATWGNEKSYFTDDFKLSILNTYLYVITGKPYTNGRIKNERLGDHMGSIDIGIEYTFEKIKVLGYRQNVYSAGALYHFANLQDGLNGISIENRAMRNTLFRWEKILFEFLYTKNQAGEPWSPDTPSPYESYYNHGQYIHGWSYNGLGLGTPFITPRNYTREELPSWPLEYFINNRVRAFHLGFEGGLQLWTYTLKASWSNNFGTYYTTDEEQTTDIPDPGNIGIFGRQDQFSACIDFSRPLKKGFTVGGIAAFDLGDLYYDSFGVLLKIAKEF